MLNLYLCCYDCGIGCGECNVIIGIVGEVSKFSCWLGKGCKVGDDVLFNYVCDVCMCGVIK